ncbi:DUF4145 domain-containing protein [Pseudomonas alkylphenolica]|uniref:DUF4145 domain-containing protein n=1 Tax=Pseudomonas alkylphenolica TaxID=237609 RepID=UPI00315D6449
MAGMNWQCPYCRHNATIGPANRSINAHYFDHGNYVGEHLGLVAYVTVCPNMECKQIVVDVDLYNTKITSNGRTIVGGPMQKWKLLPASDAIAFPEYVPQAIRQDYEEACKIKNLSPKASATLARRCLQGIIRDFKGIVKKRLVDEIEALRDQVDPDTWDAIDAVRQIGNIGAHMEKDIDVIIDVDPEEAQLLIELIETLIKDWYIARHKRQQHLEKIKAAAASKKPA